VREVSEQLDWSYVERWCTAHGTTEVLDRVRSDAGI
jgi:hypothetical protein